MRTSSLALDTFENMMRGLVPLSEKYTYRLSLDYNFGCFTFPEAYTFLPHVNLGLKEELTPGKSSHVRHWFSKHGLR